MNAELRDILSSVKMPKMARVLQVFDTQHITNYIQSVREQLLNPEITVTIKSGMHIAITASSRGIENQKLILKIIVDFIKEKGAFPFIVPAMGSHGGAKALGQVDVLAGFGITEDYLQCPITSSMETVTVGTSPEGHLVNIDKNAYEADGIIVFNRIKSHTAFRGPHESGLMKMMAIGLGKQHGAEVCHQAGFKNMGRLVPMFANVILQNCNVLFGLGLIENAYGQPCQIEAIPAKDIPRRESELLQISKEFMPKILFDDIAVLVIDEIGKNFSGDGQDPNVTSRFATPYASCDFSIQKVCVLDLSDETHGIMVGAGCADTCTRKLIDKADFEASYINAITSTVFDCIRVPMVLDTDWYAIAACIKTCNEVDQNNIRMVRIANTSDIGEIYISEAMVQDAEKSSNIKILTPVQEINFDSDGNIIRHSFTL